MTTTVPDWNMSFDRPERRPAYTDPQRPRSWLGATARRAHRPLIWSTQLSLLVAAGLFFRSELSRIRQNGARAWLTFGSGRQLLWCAAAAIGISIVDVVVISRSYWRKSRRFPPSRYFMSDDFVVLVPVFGSVKYLKNAAALSAYSGRVWVCTTNHETAEFDADLDRLQTEFGFHIVRSPTPESVPPIRPRVGPRFAFKKPRVDRPKGPQAQRDEIVRNVAPLITARTTIFLDGDTYPGDDLERIVGCFEFSRLDIASVRVVPTTSQSLAERFQTMEYELAMAARYIFPWLTSGAATVLRTSSLQAVMRRHSLFFSGGDIEAGILGKRLGMRVGHLPFTFRTDVPATLRALFHQRAHGWFIGGFRLAVVNPDQPGISSPFFVFYSTFVVYGLFAARWLMLLLRPTVFVIVVLLYTVAVAVACGGRLRPWMVAYVPYSFANSMVALPIGAVQYLRHLAHGYDSGRISVDRSSTSARGVTSSVPAPSPPAVVFAPPLPPPVVGVGGQTERAQPHRVRGTRRSLPSDTLFVSELARHWPDLAPRHRRASYGAVASAFQQARDDARIVHLVTTRSARVLIVGDGAVTDWMHQALTERGIRATAVSIAVAATSSADLVLEVDERGFVSPNDRLAAGDARIANVTIRHAGDKRSLGVRMVLTVRSPLASEEPASLTFLHNGRESVGAGLDLMTALADVLAATTNTRLVDASV